MCHPVQPTHPLNATEHRQYEWTVLPQRYPVVRPVGAGGEAWRVELNRVKGGAGPVGGRTRLCVTLPPDSECLYMTINGISQLAHQTKELDKAKRNQAEATGKWAKKKTGKPHKSRPESQASVVRFLETVPSQCWFLLSSHMERGREKILLLSGSRPFLCNDIQS